MRWLVILGGEYKELEAKDYWQARNRGASYFKARWGSRLSIALMRELVKAISLEGKYSDEDLQALLRKKGELPSEGR